MWNDKYPVAIAPGSDRTHYNPTHGRFTSVDPLTASATIRNPQTLNRYSYALNSPYKFTDPLGLLSQYTTGACGERCPNSDGSSGGWSSDYYSGQLNGPQQLAMRALELIAKGILPMVAFKQVFGGTYGKGQFAPGFAHTHPQAGPPSVGIVFTAGDVYSTDRQMNTSYYDLPAEVQKVAAPPFWRRDFVFNFAFRLDNLEAGETFTDYTFEVDYDNTPTVEGTKTDGAQGADKRPTDQLVATYIVDHDNYGEGGLAADGSLKIPRVAPDKGIDKMITGSVTIYSKGGWVAHQRFTISVNGGDLPPKATPYKLAPLVWEKAGN